MSRAPSLSGLILAAGESTRMGTDKALLAWPPTGSSIAGPAGQTFLSAAIHALSSFTDVVTVVVGKNEVTLSAVIYASGAGLVRNPRPELGQFSSLQTGLRDVLNRGRDGAMITLVDRPPASAATLQVLLTAFEAALSTGKWAGVPEYRGKHGHPVLVGREMIEAFLRAPATSTARDIEHQHQQHIQYIAVDDPFVVSNVDTPQEYSALLSQVSSQLK
jgi:molybdenum cofactor cytidylyltransferase